jgi:cobalt-zinc-cadmium efflux system outer membrane protein
LRVLTDVRLCYYQILVAQQRVAVNERLVEIADSALQTAEALLRAKEVSQLDVTRAKIEQQTARLQHRNSLEQLEAAWRRLEAVTSTHELPRCRLLGDLQDFDHHLDANSILQRIQNENPMLASAVTNVARARWAIQRAVAEPIPNVDVAAVVQSDNGTDSANANLQITIPIPWLNRNQGNIARARSELVEAQRNVDRIREFYRWQLADVYQRYAVARNRVDEYRRDEGILDQSQQALDQVSRAYRAGELPYLDLLNAQRIYSENSLSYIEALGELWEALVEMDGLLLKNSLESLEMDQIEFEP